MEVPGHQDRVARAAVEALVEGATLRWRKDQSGGGPRHDFDITLPGSRRAALEATWSCDENLTEQGKALAKHGWQIPAEDLASSWWLSLEPDAHVSTIHERVVDLLADLERAGVDDFRSYSPAKIYPVGPLRDLGVTSGNAIQTSGRNVVFLTHGGGGGIVAGSVAAKAAEREARKTDNREKLEATGLDETHLFVVMGPMTGASVVMNLCSPPDAKPDLPPEIAHLWAAARAFTEDKYVVWRGSQEEPWERLGEVGE